ncbi:MAG: hypothetical protein O9972_01125 [Burkholderiales bacterium]|nr:hypothetical protein [Burkholderiales bacterium]
MNASPPLPARAVGIQPVEGEGGRRRRAAPRAGRPLARLRERRGHRPAGTRARRARGSTLGERWELDLDTPRGRFLLRRYEPLYVKPVRGSSDPDR